MKPAATALSALLLFPAFLHAAAVPCTTQRPNNTTCTWRTSSSAQPVAPTLGSWIREQELVLLKDKASPIFDYVVDALSHVLDKLAVQHTVSDASVPSVFKPSNATYITFRTHATDRLLPTRYISYNFEQLTTSKQWSPEVFKRFRKAQAVLDFSVENIKILNARGVNNTFHVPLGYTPTLESTLPSIPKDVDVMFVGALNDKRKMKLRHLQSNNENLTVVAKICFGDDLLRLYQRSKLALNLHQYDGRTILEVHRILPLVANKVLVLSEPSNDAWWDTEYADLVNFTTSADLREPVAQLLRNSNIAAIAQQRYEQLQACCSYVKYVVDAFSRLMH